MGWFLVTVLALISLAFYLWIRAGIGAQDRKRSSLVAGRSDAEVYVGSNVSYVMLDFECHVIGLGTKDHGVEAPFSDILSVEVIENGTTVTKTDRGSQIMGAAVGAVALGGVGAVIGGLSGSTHARTNIDSLLLRIHLANRIVPSQDVVILGSMGREGADRHGSTGKTGTFLAQRWNSLVLQAMRVAASGEAAAVTAPPIEPTPEPADVGYTGAGVAKASDQDNRRRMDDLKSRLASTPAES